jgi:hypothetical protein
MFVWTVGSGWEILSAAFRSLSKEVVLLEGDVTHPCWIVTTVGAAALAEVRKEVVTCGGTWSVMPRLVFVLGVDGALVIGAICAVRVPLFATICGIVAEQIQTLESIRLHPILIVVY